MDRQTDDYSWRDFAVSEHDIYEDFADSHDLRLLREVSPNHDFSYTLIKTHDKPKYSSSTLYTKYRAIDPL